jgi:hypothetical protein
VTVDVTVDVRVGVVALYGPAGLKWLTWLSGCLG